MPKTINIDEVRLLIKALQFETLEALLTSNKFTPKIEKQLLVEYQLRDLIEDRKPRF